MTTRTDGGHASMAAAAGRSVVRRRSGKDARREEQHQHLQMTDRTGCWPAEHRTAADYVNTAATDCNSAVGRSVCPANYCLTTDRVQLCDCFIRGGFRPHNCVISHHLAAAAAAAAVVNWRSHPVLTSVRQAAAYDVVSHASSVVLRLSVTHCRLADY